MFDLLFEYLGQMVSLNSRERQQLEDALVFRQVPRKFSLIQTGDIAREIYFLNRGLIRLYYVKEGEEVTGFVFSEGLFATSYDSFLQQSPSIQNLDTLEDCDLLVLGYDALHRLYEEMPKMQEIGRKVAEQRIINAQRVVSSFVLDSPEVRYRKFAAARPDLLRRVPLQIIASYLGITPVSLSRIRKRIADSDE